MCPASGALHLPFFLPRSPFPHPLLSFRAWFKVTSCSGNIPLVSGLQFLVCCVTCSPSASPREWGGFSATWAWLMTGGPTLTQHLPRSYPAPETEIAPLPQLATLESTPGTWHKRSIICSRRGVTLHRDTNNHRPPNVPHQGWLSPFPE